MMKNSKNIAIALFAFMALTSCKKVLDKGDLGSIPGELIYNDSTLVNLNVSLIYEQNLPNWGGVGNGSVPFGGGTVTDESYGDNKFMRGTLTVEDVGDFGTALSKDNNYGKIRFINMMLADTDAGTISTHTKNRLKSQVLFFRAWRYFDLVRLYGGVPLVLTPLDGVGSEAKELALLPRNSTAECIAQIVKDLDTAIKYLPGRWTGNDWGRITRGAAAAFKGRVLLMYASPIFNPYGSPRYDERWQAAYAANAKAKEILDGDSYKLHASYGDMWFTEVGNPEAVFITGFNTAMGDQTRKNNGYDNSTRPSYTGTGGGSNQPSWELVKAYPMKDGTNPAADLPDNLFYKDRDPRFYQTIGFNGSTYPINGNPNYRLWTYYANNKTAEQKASNTGFYLRKAINPTVVSGEVQYSGTDWMEIRYAEVLLNLAESAANTSKPSEAYECLTDIRKRAGILPGSNVLYGLKENLTGVSLVNAILHERQIEFAFEGKRFWDLYRYKMFSTVLNKKSRTGVRIDLKTGPGIPTAAEFADPANAKFREKIDLDVLYSQYFTLATKPMDTWTDGIAWKDQYYFFGIPSSALNNNLKIIQNTTWGGTFDPLK